MQQVQHLAILCVLLLGRAGLVPTLMPNKVSYPQLVICWYDTIRIVAHFQVALEVHYQTRYAVAIATGVLGFQSRTL